jgi:hypothetical protein
MIPDAVGHSMNQTLQHLIGLIGLASFGMTALAQDNEIPEKPTRYEVELIVFRHVDQSRNTPEMPAEGSQVRDSPLTLNPSDSAAEPFMNTLEIGDESTNSLVPMEKITETRDKQSRVSFYLMDPRAEYPDFLPIDNASLELNSVYRRLQDLDAYRPLAHLGWIQTTRNAADAVPYQIHIRDQERDDVTGSITLYRERFLHLELDLALDPISDQHGYGSDFYSQDILDDMRAAGRRQHKLNESRRIRTPGSHYFDHPLFGVIARIQKIVVEPPADENAGETAPNPG